MHVVINVFRRGLEKNLHLGKREANRDRGRSTEMLNSSKAKLKGKMLITTCVVGERSVWGEVVAKAAVDYTEVRMPE